MSHIPLSLWSWQETIKSVFSGKVTVVDVYPDVYVRAANIKMPLPSVIALTEYAPHARGQVSDLAFLPLFWMMTTDFLFLFFDSYQHLQEKMCSFVIAIVVNIVENISAHMN